jgi:hypothetical protein
MQVRQPCSNMSEVGLTHTASLKANAVAPRAAQYRRTAARSSIVAAWSGRCLSQIRVILKASITPNTARRTLSGLSCLQPSWIESRYGPRNSLYCACTPEELSHDDGCSSQWPNSGWEQIATIARTFLGNRGCAYFDLIVPASSVRFFCHASYSGVPSRGGTSFGILLATTLAHCPQPHR